MNAAPVVLAGGSGFLGRVCIDYFSSRGREVRVLTRSQARSMGAIRFVPWNGQTLGEWTTSLDGAAALINLAGRSVNCRYHARNRRLILDSRVNSTRVLGEALARCVNPPPVWLNSSTATIYQHSINRSMDDVAGVIGSTPEAKDKFSVEVARAWEEALEA